MSAKAFGCVPWTGVEPARRFQHHPLKMACLPISPPGQGCKYTKYFAQFSRSGWKFEVILMLAWSARLFQEFVIRFLYSLTIYYPFFYALIFIEQFGIFFLSHKCMSYEFGEQKKKNEKK